jgi:hypothetical protein
MKTQHSQVKGWACGVRACFSSCLFLVLLAVHAVWLGLAYHGGTMLYDIQLGIFGVLGYADTLQWR